MLERSFCAKAVIHMCCERRARLAERMLFPMGRTECHAMWKSLPPTFSSCREPYRPSPPHIKREVGGQAGF